MTQLPINQSISRFAANEERVDVFVNDPLDAGFYTTNETSPRQVETLPHLVDRIASRHLQVVYEGDWATSTAYSVNDLVKESSVVYICVEAHTSGTFSTDLADGKWKVFQVNDAENVDYIAPFTGSVTRTQHYKNADWVSVKDFGAIGNGIIDDTAAIQSLLNLKSDVNPPPSITNGRICILFPAGSYKITSLDVPKNVDLYFDGAVLSPYENAIPRTHLIKFTGFSNIINIAINMDYCTNYDTAIWGRGRYLNFTNPNVWCAKCAWVWGDPAWEGDPINGILGDSENFVYGGTTTWGITAARLYGQNTIIHYVAHSLYSYKWTLPSDDPRKSTWEALQEYTVINVGAMLYLTGCWTGNFSGAYPNFYIKIQNASDPAYKNKFGNVFCANTHIESGFHVFCENPGLITPTDNNSSHVVSMVNCAGYVSGGRSGHLIDVGHSHQGVFIKSCNFYGNVGTNICYSTIGRVNIDESSYSDLTTDFFESIVSPSLKCYQNRTFLNANISTQSFSATPSGFAPTSIQKSIFNSALIPSYYSTSTGVFKAPTDLNNISINVKLQLSGASASSNTDISLYLNGVLKDVQPCLGVIPSATFFIESMNKNDELVVKISQYNSLSADGSIINYLIIRGNC